MKIKHVLTIASVLFCAQRNEAQTASDYISQGLSYLASSNLLSANQSFSSAVTLSPTNQTANALFGITRLLVLPYQQTGSNFLNRLGVPTSGRNIYNWMAKLTTDTNGVLLAPAGVDASEIAAVIRTNVLPRLISAGTNLAVVTDTNFLLNLSSRETPTGAVQIDYGDILLIRAALQGAAYFGYTLNSFNLYAQFTALRSLYLGGAFTPGQILSQFPQLFTFATTNDMASAAVAFSNAINLYVQASAFIRARPINEIRLFNYDLTQANKESDFRRLLLGLQASLQTTTRLDVGQHLTVNLQPLFDGLHPWRSFLPMFNDRDFVLGTLDATFQGVVTGLDLGSAEAFLAHRFTALPDFAGGGFAQGQFVIQLNVLPGRGYAIESSTDLIHWTSVAHQFATNSVITASLPPDSGQGVFYRAKQESNDRFANAYAINGLPATSGGSNAGATPEPGGPTNYFNQLFGLGSPVWWRWTATASGPVGISAAGTAFSPVLGVFTGSSLASLLPVLNLGANSPEFEFQAITGTTYFIAVESGYFFAEGEIQLSLAGPPANDNFANRQPLSGAVVSTRGSNILASEETNEPNGGGHSVWYYWSAMGSGSVAISIAGRAYPFAQVFTGDNPNNLAEVPMVYGNGTSFFDAVAGTTYLIRVDGYETGNFDLELHYFDGRYPLFYSASPSEGGSLLVQPPPDANGLYVGGTSVTITAQPSKGFVFAGLNGSITTSGSIVQIVLSINGSQSIYASFYPTNDAFSHATVLSGTGMSINGSTDGASNEPGEPGFDYETVWYSWMAPASGSVTFWLGSPHHPQVSVYTGNEITNLNPISIFSHGDSHGVTSQTFDAVADTIYRIQISGYSPSFSLLFSFSAGFYALSDSVSPRQGGSVAATPVPSTNGLYSAGTAVTLEAQPAQGFVFVGWDGNASSPSQLTLNMSASQHHVAFFRPTNDDFANRTVLTGSKVSLTGSTAGASSETGENCNVCQTVWYSWTAPTSGVVNLLLSGGSLALVNVYTGTQLTSLVPIAFVSTGAAGASSTARFDATSGTIYQIQIDGFGDAFNLGLDFAAGFYALVESIFPPESGSIIASPPPSSNGLYAAGTTVSLTAKPAGGWAFANWAGDVTSTNPTVSVVMTKSQIITANFGPP